MKRLISILLCVALLLSVVPFAVADDLTEGDFTYVVAENGEATLTGVLASPQELILPETLGGHPLTRIAKGAIANLTSKKIIVPATVRYFETNCITYCMSASVYIVGEETFYEDTAIMCVDRVYAYRNETSYAGVVITKFCPMNEYPPEPWTLEELSAGKETYAIRDGEAIVLKVVMAQDNYVLPQSLGGCSVTRIAPYAFSSAAVHTITLGEGIRSIGAHAIDKPKMMGSVNLPTTLEYVGDYAFNETKVTGDVSSIKYIGAHAFDRSSLSQITLSEQLEYIGESAFENNSISEVTIPAGVKFVGGHAFGGMYCEEPVITVLSKDAVCDAAFNWAAEIIGYHNSTAMQEAIRCGKRFVDIESGDEIPAAYVTQKNNLIYDVYYDRAVTVCVNDETVQYEIFEIEETVDGRPVTMIGNHSLSDLNAVSVIIPNTVTRVEDDAFYDNWNVQEILMSENIEFLGEDAFYNCRYLRLIFWPDNAYEITVESDSYQDPLFANSGGAYFVTLPNSKVQAFAEKGNYRVLPLVQELTYFTDGLGVYSTDGEEATVLALYHEVWETQPEEYVIPDIVYGIPVTTISGEMYWSDSFTELYLGGYIETVEDGALIDCELKELYVNKDVKYLPYPLFAEGVNATVYGYGGTYAERFCKEHGYRFEAIDDMPFKDVKKSDWYFDSVLFCYMTGLMKGTSETSFAPNATTTRAMLTQVLYNMSGAPGCSWEYGFKDVSSSDWFCEAVNWCKYYGLANGTSEFYFSPNQNVTREQVATFLYRYAQTCGIPVTSNGDIGAFSDKNYVSAYAKEAIQWAIEYGIVNGQSPTKLNPQGYATRAEIATMLMRFIAYVEPYVTD